MDPDAAGRAALGLNLDIGHLQRIPPTASKTEMIAAINRVIDNVNDLHTRTIYTDGSTRRMLIGYQEDGWGSGKHWGVKISAAGDDVMTTALGSLLFYTSY